MSIRKWHHGKLIVLWAWGIVLLAAALTDVKTAHADQSTLFRLLELLFVLCLLIALSVVTWIWLGGREDLPAMKRASAKGEQRED